MDISYDPAKNERNIATRGISFERVREFDFDTALIRQDVRNDYGEPRVVALGFIENRLHALIFTRRGEVVRVISLRKANRREVRLYEEEKKTQPVSH